MTEPERCIKCDHMTGNAGRGKDSSYAPDDSGPYCFACFHQWFVASHGTLTGERAALCGELEKLRATFDLIHVSDMRAIARWRAVDPVGRELTQPDRTDMVAWLMDELTAADGDLDLAENAIKSAKDWNGIARELAVMLGIPTDPFPTRGTFIARTQGLIEEKHRLVAANTATPGLIEACSKTLFFLNSLRAEPGDPLRAIQDRIHGPVRERLEAALTKAGAL